MNRRLITRFKWAAIGLASVLVIILLFQNTDSVALRFYFWDLVMPKLALVALSLILGIILGIVIARWPRDR